MQSRNILPKKTKEQLGKSKTRKGRLRQKGASRRIENPKGRSGQKLETLKRKITIPIDRKPERAVYAKVREHGKITASGQYVHSRHSQLSEDPIFEASTTSFLHIESEVVRGVDLVCSVYPLHIFTICPNFVKLSDVLPLADFLPINKIEPMAFCLEFLFLSFLLFL